MSSLVQLKKMEKLNIKHIFNGHQGQALVEILIGLSAAGILIGSASIAVSMALRSGATGKNYQTASSLNQKLINDIKTVVESDWNDIYGKNNKGMGYSYHIKLNISELEIKDGLASPLMVDGVGYTQSFFIDNVNRDSNNHISETGSNNDPSTQKITVRVQWLIAGQTAEISSVFYLTRWKNQISQQSDWSGGSDETAQLIKEFGNKFATSSNIDFLSVPGAIKIRGF